MEIDYNYTWNELPIEMKKEFAKHHNKTLDNLIHVDELCNIYHSVRYFKGLE